MQTSFSDLEYAAKKKVTRRDRFLAEIESITPWAALVAELEAYYPRGGGRGRPPIGLERMLRMYVAQQCFGLSDEGIEDAIYDSQAIRAFVGIDLARESAPDATTLLKFRRLLERHQLTQRIFEAINAHLAEQGLMLREGTVVDATIIAAPPSTKNRDNARDPEMHQTKKGKQYYFGMKAHIGADAATGLVHSMVATAANAADITQAHHLLHGEEQHAFGDSAYQGVDKRGEHRGSATQWHVAMKRGARRARRDDETGQALEACEVIKAKIRARVEHPFHVLKNRFGHRKVRYRGIAKNEAQLYALFGLANLLLARRRTHVVPGGGAS
ncbi:MAG: IS5 family transposase [Arhodomonas sp.]|nr:IS5 family transposase [Arhodomonas sp.]